MVDPLSALGAAAAAGQFAEQLITVIVSVIEFYNKVKDAPETTRQQLLHINQLGGICRLILQNPALQHASIASVLRTCLAQVQDIQQQLWVVVTNKNDDRVDKIKKALMAAMKDKKFDKLFEELEKQKATLLLCIAEIDA